MSTHTKMNGFADRDTRFDGSNLIVFDSTPYILRSAPPMKMRYDSILIINLNGNKAIKLKDSFGDVKKVGAIDHAMLYALENNVVKELKRMQVPSTAYGDVSTRPHFATNNTLYAPMRTHSMSVLRNEQVKQFGEPSNAEITELRRADEAIELEIGEIDIRIDQLKLELQAMEKAREAAAERFRVALGKTRQAERMADHVDMLEGDYHHYADLTKAELLPAEKAIP